ncbi:MAG: hypothetical protein ABJG47_19735 [Ekhidna sp.]
MKSAALIILIAFTSCAVPVSYVNNIPRSSGLEEKGDVLLNANVGSDARARDKNFQLGMAWSPVQHFGLAIEYSGHLRLDDMSHDELYFYSGSLIYYRPLSNGATIEFLLSAGEGQVNGDISFVNHSLFNAETFEIDARYRTRSFQANYNLDSKNEDTKLSFGFRVRNTQFSKYSYIRTLDNTVTDRSYQKDDLSIYVLDPFIESNQKLIGKLFFNSRVSYSFLDGPIRNGFRHPFYKRLGVSCGLQLKL